MRLGTPAVAVALVLCASCNLILGNEAGKLTTASDSDAGGDASDSGGDPGDSGGTGGVGGGTGGVGGGTGGVGGGVGGGTGGGDGCSPTDTRCAGSGVQTCSTSRVWGTAEACDPAVPQCSAGACGQPPSCQGLTANCGPGESCCTSPSINGGTYNRINDANYPATVSDFRLDKYEVTVGRFRKFAAAWNDGWRPVAGAGKHAYLSSGKGLADGDSVSEYEPGWDTAWATNVSTTDASRRLDDAFATWTTNANTNENWPINYVNWFESYAFCIWDEGFLPSEAEWNYAAAGGDAQRTYPWGPTVPGNNASLAVYGCYYNGTGTCTGVTDIPPVGTAPAGNGRYGQADLAGNMWEWNLDWSQQLDCNRNNCANVTNGSSFRVLRGGSFYHDASYLVSSDRNNNAPTNRDGAIGLRCARTP